MRSFTHALFVFVTLLASQAAVAQSLVSAVLPASRSVQVGTTATAFAVIINFGTATATECRIAPSATVPADFSFQTTNPVTNALTGSVNQPVDVPAGQLQTFVIAFTPTAPIAPTDVTLIFFCTNTTPALSIVGLNTLLLSASNDPIPDIVALAATLNNDGIVKLSSTGVFAVATVNVGAAGTVTAKADTGSASLPVALTICETDPATSACLSPPVNASIGVTTSILANETPTFGVFVSGDEAIDFDPAVNRVFVRFEDGNITRGSTSVAVKSDLPDMPEVPDITGFYQGTGNVTLANCVDAGDNGTFFFDAVFNVSSQNGSAFSGTGTLTTTVQGFFLVENGNYSGTIAADGSVSGIFSSTLFIDGEFDSSDNGTFTGQLTGGGTLTLETSGQDTVGDTCTSTGSITVS